MTPAEIREARISLGLTQSALATALEVDPNDLSRIECGRKRPPVRFIRLLRAMLDGYRPD